MSTPQEEEEEENYEEQSPSTSCSCFNFCLPKTHKYSNLTGPGDYHHQSRTSPDSWLVEKLKNIKEMTESIAGPEFKTSVRKIGGYFTKQKQRNKNGNNMMQYDAYNYALNFDSGRDDDDYDENVGFSRFPATPLLDGRRPAGAATDRSESL